MDNSISECHLNSTCSPNMQTASVQSSLTFQSIFCAMIRMVLLNVYVIIAIPLLKCICLPYIEWKLQCLKCLIKPLAIGALHLWPVCLSPDRLNSALNIEAVQILVMWFSWSGRGFSVELPLIVPDFTSGYCHRELFRGPLLEASDWCSYKSVLSSDVLSDCFCSTKAHS